MMTDEEYSRLNHLMHLNAGLILDWNLEGFLERAGRAEAVGPILNPTLYREKAGALEADADIARAFHSLQRELKKIFERGKQR